ncbi:MAG: nucleotidyl transferase AbiEii/AbiGii toxin family protein [Bacteroidales bacterium]|nr:nucleotidyl transferase AbiEii/AbiGii toxin family protein [Bacteroidales bacterium]
MIQIDYIDDWGLSVPWKSPSLLEQDLIISRALVEIFKDPFLCNHLAFRGGTALGKLFLKPQPRYSEDIDLVQVMAEPIKDTISHLRDALSFLGNPVVKQKKHNNTLVYHIQSSSEDLSELRLKVEINCKEHFCVFPRIKKPFSVENGWFSGSCEILTYELEELVGTKMRALYQRRKGRDLFDIFQALTRQNLDTDKIIHSYQKYLSFVASHMPTYKEFVLNMTEKMSKEEFLHDTDGILDPSIIYNPQEAYDLVHSQLIEKLQKK